MGPFIDEKGKIIALFLISNKLITPFLITIKILTLFLIPNRIIPNFCCQKILATKIALSCPWNFWELNRNRLFLIIVFQFFSSFLKNLSFFLICMIYKKVPEGISNLGNTKNLPQFILWDISNIEYFPPFGQCPRVW